MGVDTTPESHRALDLARRLARGGGAAVVAVAVVDDRLPLDAAPFGEIVKLGQWDEIIAERREKVGAALDALVGGDPAITPEIRVGYPVSALSEAAAGADLLIVGSRRWGALDRIVIGSTSEELCRRAPCSVLVVPRAAVEEPARGRPADAAAEAAS